MTARRTGSPPFVASSSAWVVMRFEGLETDIRFDQAGADFQPEFTDWRWADIDALATTCPFYKVATYKKVAAFLRGVTVS